MPALNTAIAPVPRDESWLQIHLGHLERIRAGGIEVAFFGDSLTHCWMLPDGGAASWDRWFAPLGAANFGIGGDRTQHLLWRLANGASEGYRPKAVVLLIGTNNTGHEYDGATPRNTPAEAVLGIQAVIERLRHSFPAARLLVLALLPRGHRRSVCRVQVAEINGKMAAQCGRDGLDFLDFSAVFLDRTGRLNRRLMPDLLHLNPEGYRRFANALSPHVIRALATSPVR